MANERPSQKTLSIYRLKKMATIQEVKQYWQENPLLSFELNNIGSAEFFKEFNRIKREDIERFALAYWEFDVFRNKKVLEVGCGPGWLTTHYALAGADVYAIDLTPRAVKLTQNHLQYKNTSAHIQEASAEELPFKENTFDLVVASGVLHHTPNTSKAIRECFRVTKPNAQTKITLYRKGIPHANEFLFNFTKLVMKWLKIKHPGSDMARTAKTIDDFIRYYDGELNPHGIAKTTKEWAMILKNEGFLITKQETHFFPKRFLPFHKFVPTPLHYLLDRFLGTMVYFDLTKPSS